MTRLPIVKHEGQLWYFDERLMQIRGYYSPHKFQNLNDFEMVFFLNVIKNNTAIEVIDCDGEEGD